MIAGLPKHRTEKQKCNDYLGEFRIEESKSFRVITGIFKCVLLKVVVRSILEAYDDYMGIGLIKRTHKRSLKCLWKLMEDNWEGIEVFLDNMVLENENHELIGKESAILSIQELQRIK